MDIRTLSRSKVKVLVRNSAKIRDSLDNIRTLSRSKVKVSVRNSAKIRDSLGNIRTLSRRKGKVKNKNPSKEQTQNNARTLCRSQDKYTNASLLTTEQLPDVNARFVNSALDGRTLERAKVVKTVKVHKL